ncbi:MAG: hypothetical protein NTU69_08150 [Proteobacteria bacterium]|nr:hypothetical protein [Pseudomonadota bacterium]
MGILKTLRLLKLNGEILQPGEMFRTPNEQGLVDKGYARHLNKDETAAILDEYVLYAERMFNDKSRQQNPPVKHVQGILFNNGD